MTGGRSLWRTILWIERFLPTPVPVTPDAERSAASRRRAALVPLLVIPTIVIPGLVRQRHELREIMLQNRVLFEQLTLVIAGCVVVAAIGFGVKAWRDATRAE